jgi:hypothetical protein
VVDELVDLLTELSRVDLVADSSKLLFLFLRDGMGFT